MHYDTVKSDFVKNLIRGASWKDRVHRRYVDDLIEIERYLLTGPKGFGDALRTGMLKEKYSREWMIIFKELKPKEYELFLKENRQRRKAFRERAERQAREHNAREERLRKEWLEMGGVE